MKRIFISLMLLAAILPARAQKLVILHTNDTHSQIEPVRTGRNAGSGGVDRRLYFIDSVRAEYGKNKVLLLDAGDYNQGTPYFNIGGGDLERDLMNLLGYDAVAIGNHEFDNGQAEFARRLSEAKYPTICCNYNFDGTPLEGCVEPYVIIKRGGFKIGIIGATVRLRGMVSAQNIEGMEQLNTIEVVNEYAALLKKQKKCDLVILLSHLGYDGGSEDNPSDQIMAAQSRNIDFIIGGHSHTFLKEPLEVENLDGELVPIVQAGCKGIEIGELKIY
ncbi:MAG: metallophosphoesterase [Bacteroidales bacterium]|nr:metallophosphoesterase [Bacteroidales bacterium]